MLGEVDAVQVQVVFRTTSRTGCTACSDNLSRKGRGTSTIFHTPEFTETIYRIKIDQSDVVRFRVQIGTQYET
jgi:positive regulator of sigma E activity